MKRAERKKYIKWKLPSSLFFYNNNKERQYVVVCVRRNGSVKSNGYALCLCTRTLLLIVVVCATLSLTLTKNDCYLCDLVKKNRFCDSFFMRLYDVTVTQHWCSWVKDSCQLIETMRSKIKDSITETGGVTTEHDSQLCVCVRRNELPAHAMDWFSLRFFYTLFIYS